MLVRVLRAAAALTMVPVALVVATAHVAAADPALAGTAAAERVSIGAVGIVAVLVGVGGLVAGLVRRRRAANARSAAMPVHDPRQPAKAAAHGDRIA